LDYLLPKTHQQEKTKDFFEGASKEWSDSAKISSKSLVNVIKQRNKYVEKTALKYLKKPARLLDIGCGTGDLVITLLKKGFDAFGIDFASSMIDTSKKEALSKNLSLKHFILNSFFDYHTNKKFDLISANGFIEYISQRELRKFSEKSYQMLKNNGFLVVGSRNRLFNVFSYNDYTEQEIQNNTILNLIEECMVFNNTKKFNDLLKSSYKQSLSRNLKKHQDTGIGVETRYQYTPFQLISLFQNQGFELIDLYPINIHLFTVGARRIEPKLHDLISNQIQKERSLFLPLIPQSSSFMLTVRK